LVLRPEFSPDTNEQPERKFDYRGSPVAIRFFAGDTNRGYNSPFSPVGVSRKLLMLRGAGTRARTVDLLITKPPLLREFFISTE
jgi:hypothetical protein